MRYWCFQFLPPGLTACIFYAPINLIPYPDLTPRRFEKLLCQISQWEGGGEGSTGDLIYLFLSIFKIPRGGAAIDIKSQLGVWQPLGFGVGLDIDRSIN